MNNLLNGHYYQANAFLGRRFAEHVVLGLKKNIGDRELYPKNLLEKIGDAGLWVVEDLPGKLWRGLKDPRVVTLGLTALALLGASFAFYPITTLALVKTAVALIPLPPLWAVKFSAYIFTVGLIISGAARAQGRFFNTALMEAFYGRPKQVPQIEEQKNDKDVKANHVENDIEAE